jgi:N-hydroxyarylamine O-acetyltransferase
MASVAETVGRARLSRDRLIVTEDVRRHERTLAGDAEILAAYRRYFGISLDRVPVVVED